MKVVVAGCGASTPLAGVMAYCERVAEFIFATNIQESSLRMAIEVGPELVATGAAVNAVKAPLDELML